MQGKNLMNVGSVEKLLARSHTYTNLRRSTQEKNLICATIVGKPFGSSHLLLDIRISTQGNNFGNVVNVVKHFTGNHTNLTNVLNVEKPLIRHQRIQTWKHKCGESGKTIYQHLPLFRHKSHLIISWNSHNRVTFLIWAVLKNLLLAYSSYTSAKLWVVSFYFSIQASWCCKIFHMQSVLVVPLIWVKNVNKFCFHILKCYRIITV